MRAAGIDIGSRAIKLVLLEEGQISTTLIADTTHDPIAACRAILAGIEYDGILATGYGRHLFAERFQCEVVSEIKAVALGARELHPSCRAVVDIGGQDTKAVSLDTKGRLHKFAMNDRCAAGTGRFLEVMATALSFTLPEFVEAALTAERAELLSSMCTVFAESEVISLVARGRAREDIALGIHQSIATRTLSLIKRVPIEGTVLFAGGGALNRCLPALLERGLGRPVRVPESPQVVTALGAALSVMCSDPHP